MYGRLDGRHQCAVKRRLRVKTYQSTEKGRAAKRRAISRHNTRRVYIGNRYLFSSSTASEARAVNAHIRERLLAFKSAQRAEAAARR